MVNKLNKIGNISTEILEIKAVFLDSGQVVLSYTRAIKEDGMEQSVDVRKMGIENIMISAKSPMAMFELPT